jgi:ABC-type antimicrobial peptide transport system permease subunit
LGRQRFEVVGVTEPHAYLSGQAFVNFWAPLTMAGAFPGVDPWSEPDAASLVVIGRLRQDATAASMRAWLEVWLRQRFSQRPMRRQWPHIDSLATRIPLEGAHLALVVLILSAFGLVLLVACANVTNLMLARALTRQPEITVRLALGASRWRVARQLIVESLVLAVPATAMGLAPSSSWLACFCRDPPHFLPACCRSRTHWCCRSRRARHGVLSAAAVLSAEILRLPPPAPRGHTPGGSVARRSVS